jgi:hypothetical protein
MVAAYYGVALIATGRKATKSEPNAAGKLYPKFYHAVKFGMSFHSGTI